MPQALSQRVGHQGLTGDQVGTSHEGLGVRDATIPDAFPILPLL